MNRRIVAPFAALLLGATACSTGQGAEAADPPPTASAEGHGTSEGHGTVEGAREIAEPPLGLLSVDDTGAVALLDLLDGSSTSLDAIAPPTSTATDGRYLFATTEAGVEIVDSGRWTWDHGDHFHYYRSDAALLGTVPGSGTATIATGPLSTAGGTGLFFPGSGEAVLLDNEALSEGERRERFRLDVGPHDGLVAPLGDGAAVTVPDASGAVTAVRRYDADGTPVEGSTRRCPDASGTIATAVGVVIGCADGALLWTESGGRWHAERIPYPDGVTAPPATEFHAREGRPTVAALAGLSRIWLLDTRERTWDLVEAGAELIGVSAADDEGGHVLALDRAGRVRVHRAGSGRLVAISEPLLTGARRPEGVGLVVDDQRAYLNDPAGGRVLEIDYADGARVARELTTSTAPDLFAEVGR